MPAAAAASPPSSEGKAALGRYLQMKPAAPDAPFIRQMAG
jgi:hypothetical protein